jgi:hypothetical protein
LSYTAGDGWPYDTREYMSVRLTTPLVIGQAYYVAMHVSLAHRDEMSDIYFAKATNRLGTLFTITPFLPGVFDPPPNHAHVFGMEVITDSIGWQIIEGTSSPMTAPIR